MEGVVCVYFCGKRKHSDLHFEIIILDLYGEWALYWGRWEGCVVSDCPLTQAAISLGRSTPVRYVD